MIKRAASAAAVAILSIAVLLASHAPPRAEAASLFVWNPGDSGFGTFRWAVEQANYNSSINLIVLKNSVPITLYSTVEYWGSQNLTIQGDRALSYRAVQGTGGGQVSVSTECSLFESTGGADLTFYQVTFQNTDCSAIEVYADSDDGEVIVTLNKTIIRDIGGHGLYMSEGGDGSASWNLKMTNSRVENTGLFGYDAVHVSEYDIGDIIAAISGTAIVDNGGDGLELDEEDSGNIQLTASNSIFNNNDDFGSESLAASATGSDDVEVDEGDDGDVSSTGDVGTADHSGADGIDIDESGDGNVSATLTNVQASGNGEEGLDLDEDDNGNMSLTASGVTADDNDNEGIEAEETGNGNFVVKLTTVQTSNNGDEGVDIEERDDGNLDFQASGSSSNMNGDDGYELHEHDNGNFDATFSNVIANANDDDGFDLEEWGDGSFMAALYNCTATFNGDEAVEADADGETGTIIFNSSTLIGGIDLDNVDSIP